jgi:hypothetical protein
MKKVAILQSNYIPWKGYFDLIANVDEFVFFDSMQYTKRDWRNRNLIKTPQGLRWITVPVQVKGRYHQSIYETRIDGEDWRKLHLKTFQQNYGRAKFYEEIKVWLEPLYLEDKYCSISQLNQALIIAICNFMEINTVFLQSSDFVLSEDKSVRLAHICERLNANSYLSGPSAMGYLDESPFTQAGISVEWIDYVGYPEYQQLWGGFEHGVTILDLLFNCGKDARKYLKVKL